MQDKYLPTITKDEIHCVTSIYPQQMLRESFNKLPSVFILIAAMIAVAVMKVA